MDIGGTMNAILFSAYALANISPQTAVLPHLHSPGVGHLYYDSSQYTVCGDALMTTVLQKDFQRSRDNALDCPGDRPPLLTFRKETGAVTLSGDLDQWCFGAAQGGGMFIAGLGPHGDLPDDVAGSHCIKLGIDRTQLEVEIDISVLKGVGGGDTPLLSPALRCTALLQLLHSSAQDGPLFSVFTGMGARRREIEYWLDICATDIPTLHLWEYTDYYKNERDMKYFSFISRCTVRKVSNFESVPPLPGGTNTGAIQCIEDFMHRVSPQRSPAITFLSPGVGPPRNDQNEYTSQHQQENINEVLGVTAAFLDSQFSRLNIRSMWRAHNLLQDTMLTTTFRDTLQTLSQSSRVEVWSTEIDTLWDDLSGCSLLGDDDPLCWGRVSIILAYELSATRSVLPSLVSGGSLTDNIAELAQYLRRVAMTAAQFQFPYIRRYNNDVAVSSECENLVSSDTSFRGLDIPSMTAAEGQLLSASWALEARSVPGMADVYGKEAGNCAVNNTQGFKSTDWTENVFFEFNGYSPSGPPRSGHPKTYDLPVCFTDSQYSAELKSWKTEIVNIKNSEGKVYVLCFVRAGEDLNRGREIVQQWREGCQGCRFHAVFTVYEIPSCAEFSGASNEAGCTLRLALLALYEWIVTNTVKVDIVVALVGIEAMLAFRHPGASDTGIIPNGVYGGFAYYRLHRPLSFAVNEEGEVDFRAFAGVASAVKSLVEGLRSTDPAYTLDFLAGSTMTCSADKIGCGGIPGSILRYLRKRYYYLELEELLDISSSYFDFNHATWDSSLIEAHLPTTDFGDTRIRSGESLILSYRIPDDVLFPLMRSGSTVKYQDFVDQIRLAASLMNQENCLDAVIAAAKMYYVYSRSLADIPSALNFYLELSKKFYLYSHTASVRDKLEMLDVFRELVKGSNDLLFAPHADGAVGIHTIVYRIAQTAIYQELGPVDLEVKTFGDTLIPIPYVDVNRRRVERRVSASNVGARTFILTVASEETSGLRALLTSAYLAGVSIEVVGLGRAYTDYTQKIVWYLEALGGVNTTVKIRDDDVVVLIDAYDVLLFPAVRRIAEGLSEFPTPIVFCSENGIYPEFAAPWYYHRGDNSEDSFNVHNQGDQRYLNSGCIAGSAKEVKRMLRAVANQNEIFRDDQQVFVRYLVENPHLVSIDVNRKLFVTGYKEPMNKYGVSFVLGLATVAGREVLEHGSVSLIHCNSKDSNNAYYSVMTALYSFYNRYLLGRDGPSLMAAIHSIWDRECSTASEHLLHATVLLNASTPSGEVGLTGGTNVLSHKLKEFLSRHDDICQ